MIEVTETVVKSYDLSEIVSRIDSLENANTIMLVVLFAAAHFKMDYIGKLLKE